MFVFPKKRALPISSRHLLNCSLLRSLQETLFKSWMLTLFAYRACLIEVNNVSTVSYCKRGEID